MNPLHKNQSYSAEIIDTQPQGNGIARVSGKSIIIPYALFGEVVSFKLIKLTPKQGIGKLLSVQKASPDRHLPACPIFYRCGGCQLQHMTYHAQCQHKWQHLKRTFSDYTALAKVSISPIVPASASFYYRNKAQFSFGIESKTGGLLLGLYATHSNQIIDAPTCALQSEGILSVYKQIRFFFESCVPLVSLLFLRHLVIREAMGTSDIMIAFVCEKKVDPFLFSELVAHLSSSLSVKSILMNVNSDSGNTILGDETICLYGTQTLAIKTYGLTFKLSLHSFTQSNPMMAEAMFDFITQNRPFGPDDVVWDLYCGIGILTLSLSRYCKTILGIEIVPDAISDARSNAMASGILNASFICADISTLDLHSFDRPHTIVLDPPRKGCEHAVLEALLAIQAPHLIYISCHPVSLARDLDILVQGGYDITRVTPFDNFSQTHHLEMVVYLKNV